MKTGPRQPAAIGAGQHGRRVVDRALERVGLLAPGELEDDRADVARLGRLVDRPRHVEGLGAQVDRRHGEAGDLAAGSRVVQLLDARRAGAELLARLPDEPLGGRGRRLVVANAAVQARSRMRGVAEGGLVVDDQPVAVEMGAAGEEGQQVGRARSRRGASGWVSCRVGHRSWYRRVPDAPADGQAQRPGLTTIRKTMMTIRAAEEHPAALDLLDGRRDLGGGGPGGVPGGGGVEDSSIR